MVQIKSNPSIRLKNGSLITYQKKSINCNHLLWYSSKYQCTKAFHQQILQDSLIMDQFQNFQSPADCITTHLSLGHTTHWSAQEFFFFFDKSSCCLSVPTAISAKFDLKNWFRDKIPPEKISPKKNIHQLVFSVATLFRFVARFARVRIEDSSRNRFTLNGI